MKLLLMGDRHNTIHKPVNRTDADFMDTQIKKDTEILRIAKKNNVSAIIHPGDFWTDSDCKIKNDFICDVVKRWFPDPNQEKNIPMYGIAGNHDLFGKNLNTLPFTTTGLLDALGYIKLLHSSKPVTFQLKNKKTVAITGVNYHINMDKPEHIDDYIIEKKLGDIHIHVVHGMLLKNKSGIFERYTTIDQITHTKADITFSGHDHVGFGIIKKDSKYFVNPGSVIRSSCNASDIKRDVKVLIVDINEDDLSIDIKEVPLKSALDGNLVLSRITIEKEKEKQAATEKLKSNIKKLKLAKKVKFLDILENVYKEKDIAETTKKDLDNRVTTKLAQKEAATKNLVGTNIKTVRLQNFQSHKDTTIDLSTGFNILLGESRQGKTAIIRGIRWVLENKPSGKNMIQHGQTDCFVTITLENNTIITRYITEKSNGYKIILPDGTIEEGNTKMVDQVQEICGFSKLDADTNTSLPLNFMAQGSGWYLIGDTYSSSDRARILGALQNTNVADGIIKDIEREKLQNTTLIRNKEFEIKEKQEDLKTLSCEIRTQEKIKELIEKKLLLVSVKTLIEQEKALNKNRIVVDRVSKTFDEEKATSILQTIKEKQALITLIEENLDKSKSLQSDIKSKEKTIALLEDISTSEKKLYKTEQLCNKIESIKDSCAVARKETTRQKKLDKIIGILCRVKTTEDIYTLKERVNTAAEIHKVACMARKYKKISALIEKTLNSTHRLEKGKQDLLRLKELLNTLDKIRAEFVVIKKQQANVKNNKERIKECSDKIEAAKKEKQALLENFGYCPTCMTKIN